MRDVFFFDKMLTPKIVTFVYWLALFGVFVSALTSMFAGYDGFTFGKFFMGLVYMAVGAVAVRIWFEILMVIFKINEALQDIRNK